MLIYSVKLPAILVEFLHSQDLGINRQMADDGDRAGQAACEYSRKTSPSRSHRTYVQVPGAGGWGEEVDARCRVRPAAHDCVRLQDDAA